jgi:hypothetical protein
MSAAGSGSGRDLLLRALTARVESSSLRQVAREVGMSPTGLKKVLDGASPYAPTRAKLERWLVREAAMTPAFLDADSAGAALDLLVSGLPVAARAGSKAEVIAAVRAQHDRAGVKVPPWLDAAAGKVKAGPGT